MSFFLIIFCLCKDVDIRIFHLNFEPKFDRGAQYPLNNTSNDRDPGFPGSGKHVPALPAPIICVAVSVVHRTNYFERKWYLVCIFFVIYILGFAYTLIRKKNVIKYYKKIKLNVMSCYQYFLYSLSVRKHHQPLHLCVFLPCRYI